MFSFLKNIFKTSDTWTEYTLIKNIRLWQDSGFFPFESSVPNSFILSDNFWKRCLDIFKYTGADSKEHAISAWSIYKQVFFTDVVTGTADKVTTNDRVEVKFDHIQVKRTYLRRISVNGKERSKDSIPYSDMPRNNKEAELRYLFNVHTHPKYTTSSGNSLYGNFSLTDIKSYFSTNVLATGLVTDKVTFLLKTRNSPKDISKIISGLEERSSMSDDFLKSELKLAIYEAFFYDKVFRKKV